MTDKAMRRQAWRAAIFGMPDPLKTVHVERLRASRANVLAGRDEAAREYEYVHRAFESLDNKAGIALAGSLALFTVATTSDGQATWARWIAGALAFVAGVFAATTLAPYPVRGMSAAVMVGEHGEEDPDRFVLRIATQYADATEALRLPVLAKARRVQLAFLLLFLSATTLAA